MSHPRSPVLTLENAIAGAAFLIAPEKEDELAEFRDRNAISLVIKEGTKFKVKANSNSCEISTNVATLEYLWASAYAHLVLYDEYAKAQGDGQESFDTSANSRLKTALELLDWAERNLTDTGNAPWPPHLPAPVETPTPRSDIHIATELFLCSVAWIMHHELAHLRLDHPDIESSRSLIEEKEADKEATQWILCNSGILQESRKRTLGIAAAILAIQGQEKLSDFSVRNTHPKAYERIDNCLTAASVKDDDEIYAFAACILQFYLASRGIRVLPDGKSFKEMFSELLVTLARL